MINKTVYGGPKIILQPDHSRCCGQCCVAMAAGVTLEESIRAFGHRHATTTKHVTNALEKLGRWHGRISHGPLMRVKDGMIPVTRAIVRLRWSKRKNSGSHWVLLWDNNVYCSVSGRNPDWSGFPEAHYTAYMEVVYK